MSERSVTCHHCSEVFSAFLEEIADHNERVTCPACNTSDEYAPCDFHGKSSEAVSS